MFTSTESPAASWHLIVALACAACSGSPSPNAGHVEPATDPAPTSHPAPSGRIRLGASASCRDSAPCKWSSGDLFLTVRLANTSDVPIAVPIEHMQKRGPSIELVDTRTKAALQIPTNLAPDELAERRVTIPPGGAESTTWVLHDVELTHFGRPVDLTARITLFSDMLVGGDKVPFEATTTLAIRE